MARMSDERMIRADNLRLLMKQHNLTKAELARQLETSDTYVQKLLSGKPGTFGEKAARRVEESFKKPRFWMDMVHAGGEYSHASLEEQRIEPDAERGLMLRVTEDAGASRSYDAAVNAGAISFPTAPVIEWARLGVDLFKANAEWPASDRKAVPTQRSVSDQVKWIPVHDDALAPKILPGDLVAIDPCGEPQRDEVALFRTPDGSFLLRRYQPLAVGGFEAVDAQGRVLDSVRHGLTVVGSLVGMFREKV